MSYFVNLKTLFLSENTRLPCAEYAEINFALYSREVNLGDDHQRFDVPNVRGMQCGDTGEQRKTVRYKKHIETKKSVSVIKS